MNKLPKLVPSEMLLPARMSLNLDGLREVRFATLNFPYEKALDAFVTELTKHYNFKHNRSQYDKLDFEDRPPFRQLNTALMACCPVLVHAFEKYGQTLCMVAIDQLERDPATNEIHSAGPQFPSVDSLRDPIETWIDQWLKHTDLIALVNETPALDNALKTLKRALEKPETKWQENITLDGLVNELSQDGAMGYSLIPAALIALLHNQCMTINTQSGLEITWRKAHDGGANGLHLVSQPIYGHYGKRKPRSKKIELDDESEETEGYYAYRLDFRVQTQVGRQDAAGHLIPWVFVDVGMRRYAHEPFKSDKVYNRRLSVLFGFNREQLPPADRSKFARYLYDSTLIALPVDIQARAWDGHLTALLNAYGLSTLDEAANVLAAPMRYGNLQTNANFKGNEYYVIHAEGRKYGDAASKGQGHNHGVKPGLSLKNRTEVVQRVLELLPDVLIPDDPFEPDIAAPKGQHVPYALRDHSFFQPKKQDSAKRSAEKLAATLKAIRRAVQLGGHEQLDIAIIHSSPHFLTAVREQLRAILPNGEAGTPPFIRIHEVNFSPMFFQPLDAGDLDPRLHYTSQRPSDFKEKWNVQMKRARQQKVDEWRNKLRAAVDWRPNTQRLALIESFHKDVPHDSQYIKGAVREACSREGIATQFVGAFKARDDGALKPGDKGRLESAVLDLLLRQTGALYGTPADLYARAARLSEAHASNLDVVAFWHENTFTPLNPKKYLATVIAVRLRANGQVEVITPQTIADGWLPYLEAGVRLGKLFADERSAIAHKKGNLLQLDNIQVMQFVQKVLTQHLKAPTIAVIPAAWWRNSRSSFENTARWPQLGNKHFFANQDVLDFSHIPNGEKFARSDPRLANLIGVIRLRLDDETPQYTVGTPVWDAARQTGDVADLSGYVDCRVLSPLHYFSLAAESDLQKEQSQNTSGYKDAYKTDLSYDYAYKHAQLVELVPFFLRADFKDADAQQTLCRCVHFLRISPAFSKANIRLPYPMHLASALIDDLLCIVDIY